MSDPKKRYDWFRQKSRAQKMSGVVFLARGATTKRLLLLASFGV